MTYDQVFMLWRSGEMSDAEIGERCRADEVFARWFAKRRSL